MNIGVIGNSHMAAFKLGWEILKTDFPGIKLTFFGATGISMRFLRVEEGALVPTNDSVRTSLLWTSGGLDRIPNDMNAYLLVGMGFSFVNCMALFKTHRPLGCYDQNDETQQLISDSFFYSAMERTLSNSNASKVLALLKGITSAPIIYVPNPFSSEAVLSSAEHPQYQVPILCERVFDYFENALGNLSPAGCVCSQPADTVVDGMYTKEEYSRGSIKLKQGMTSYHKEDDYFHMNAEFGVCYLREILKYIGPYEK